MKRLPLILFLLSILSLNASAQIWQPLSEGLKYTPVAMTQIEKSLAVAYEIEDNGPKGKKFGVSIWTGNLWTALPAFACDSGARILTLKYYKGALYIAGRFNQFNSFSNVRSIVKWEKNRYVTVPNISSADVKFFETINHLDITNELLVVAGDFTSSVIKDRDNFAFFDGTNWKEPSIKELQKINGSVYTSISVKDHIYVGGSFSKIGTTQSKYLAHFENGELIPFENNGFKPRRMVLAGEVVYSAGSYNTIEDPIFFGKIEKDTVVKIMSGLEKVSSIQDLVSTGTDLYACGSFVLSGNSETSNIIRYSGGKWSAIDKIQLEGINILYYMNGALIAAGKFQNFRSIELNRIAVIRKEEPNALIRGRVYHDKNNDCVFDGRDENLSENLIKIQPGNIVIRPRINGQFYTSLSEGKYTITVVPGKYWSSSSCSSLSKTIEVKNGELYDSMDFPLQQQSGIKDLSVDLTSSSGSRAVANHVQQYMINFKNLGSSELVKGTVSLKFDSRLKNLVALPKPTKVIGDSAVWSISDLSPGEKGVIRCFFKMDRDASDQLQLQASVNQQAQETDDNNNTSSLTQKIMDEDVDIHKFVNPGSNWSDTAIIHPESDQIQYQISFANYSQDTVRTVYVVDTVALNSTIQSIVDIAASHPVIPITLPGPKYSDYAILIYKFENINLPPNPTKNGEIVNDEGHITFQMNMSGNLTIGDKYLNRAEVIFDYEFEKMTNTVAAIVEENSSVNAFNKPVIPVDAYPNPTENSIVINYDFDNLQPQYSVASITGKVLSSGVLNDDNKINLAGFSQGLYYISLSDENKTYTAKVIKY